MNDFESIPINWAVCNLFDVCKPTQWKTITINQLQPTGYPVYGANGIIGYYENYNLKLRSPLKKRYHNKKSSQRE